MSFKGIPIKSEDIEVVLENKKVKQQNVKAGELMQEVQERGNKTISERTVERVQDCASYMEFLRGIETNPESFSQGKEKKIVTTGNFCGNRFCPVCSKTKAKKDAIRLRSMTAKLEEQNQRFIFVTLTVPNCKGADLGSTLTTMNDAFNRYIKLKQFNGIFNGYVKKVEVTYNSDKNSKAYDTYHPHFHVLFAVDNSYFNGRNYITHDKWLKKWQQVMKDPTISQVNVKSIPKNKVGDSILELSKYIAKDSDYLHSTEVFETFYNSLKGRRMLTYGGCFKDLLKEYEDGKLDDFTFKSTVEVIDYLRSVWNIKDYDTKSLDISKFTPEQVNEINSLLIKRGYVLYQDSITQKWLVSYVDKTTYGEELTDD